MSGGGREGGRRGEGGGGKGCRGDRTHLSLFMTIETARDCTWRREVIGSDEGAREGGDEQGCGSGSGSGSFSVEAKAEGPKYLLVEAEAEARKKFERKQKGKRS